MSGVPTPQLLGQALGCFIAYEYVQTLEVAFQELIFLLLVNC